MDVAIRNHSLCGCSALGFTEGEVTYPQNTKANYPADTPSGVLSGHAYSIIDAFVIEANLVNEDGDKYMEEVRLVRLRNPWGKKEWSGAWSDGSEEIMDNMPALNSLIR